MGWRYLEADSGSWMFLGDTDLGAELPTLLAPSDTLPRNLPAVVGEDSQMWSRYATLVIQGDGVGSDEDKNNQDSFFSFDPLSSLRNAGL